MDLTGTIIAVLPAQSGVSARTGNRIKQFALQQGQQNVTIQFDIDAHEHDGRWYNEVRCYNVLRAVPAGQVPQPTAQAAPQAQSAAPFPPANAAPQQGNDDLPF